MVLSSSTRKSPGQFFFSPVGQSCRLELIGKISGWKAAVEADAEDRRTLSTERLKICSVRGRTVILRDDFIQTGSP